MVLGGPRRSSAVPGGPRRSSCAGHSGGAVCVPQAWPVCASLCVPPAWPTHAPGLACVCPRSGPCMPLVWHVCAPGLAHVCPWSGMCVPPVWPASRGQTAPIHTHLICSLSAFHMCFCHHFSHCIFCLHTACDTHVLTSSHLIPPESVHTSKHESPNPPTKGVPYSAHMFTSLHVCLGDGGQDTMHSTVSILLGFCA